MSDDSIAVLRNLISSYDDEFPNDVRNTVHHLLAENRVGDVIVVLFKTRSRLPIKLLKLLGLAAL